MLILFIILFFFFFFQAEDGIRDADVTGVQTCALPISAPSSAATWRRSGAICASKRAAACRMPRRSRGARSSRVTENESPLSRAAPVAAGLATIVVIFAIVEAMIRIGWINRFIVSLPSAVLASFGRVI